MPIKSFIFVLLLFARVSSFAQELPAAQLGPIYTEAQYQSWNLPSRKILSLHQGKIYALVPSLVKSKKTYGLDFVVFDEEMHFQEKTFIPLQATKRYRFRKFLRCRQETYIVMSYIDAKSRSTRLLAQALDLEQMTTKGPLRTIATYPNLPFVTQTQFKIILSPNRQKVLLSLYMESGDQGIKHLNRYYNFTVLDETLNPLWQYEPESTGQFKHYLNPIINNDGVVVCSKHPSLSKPMGYQKGQKKKIIIIASGQELATHWINKANAPILEHNYIVADSGQSLICMGISGVNLELSKGYFITKYSLIDGSEQSRKFIPFDFQTLNASKTSKIKDLKIRLIWEPQSETLILLLQQLDPTLNLGVPSQQIFGDCYLIWTQGNGESIRSQQVPQSKGGKPLSFILTPTHIDFFYHQSLQKEGKKALPPQHLPVNTVSIKKATQLKQIRVDWEANVEERVLVDNGKLGYGIWPATYPAQEGQTYVFLGFAWIEARFIKLIY